MTRCTLAELHNREITAPAAMFHTAPTRDESGETLTRLRDAVVAPHVIFVASRHHAPQISYLLAAGADRCVVEPVYPAEVNSALKSLGGAQ